MQKSHHLGTCANISRKAVCKNVIEIEQEAEFQPEFHQNELVTWHDYQGKKCVPIPAVVVLQDAESVLIRTCVEGLLKELRVNPNQLAHR